jgi:hypothetical protein
VGVLEGIHVAAPQAVRATAILEQLHAPAVQTQSHPREVPRGPHLYQQALLHLDRPVPHLRPEPVLRPH